MEPNSLQAEAKGRRALKAEMPHPGRLLRPPRIPGLFRFLLRGLAPRTGLNVAATLLRQYIRESVGLCFDKLFRAFMRLPDCSVGLVPLAATRWVMPPLYQLRTVCGNWVQHTFTA